MSRLRRGSRTAVEGDSDSMKLLFDQNLSHRLVTMLAPEFAGSRHVRDWGMADAADPVVWAHATQEGFVIVSKDSDFQQRAVLLGHPPKVVWIRLGNCSTHVVSELLRVRLPICWPSKPIRSHRFLLFHDFGSVRLCPIVLQRNNVAPPPIVLANTLAPPSVDGLTPPHSPSGSPCVQRPHPASHPQGVP